MNRDFGNDLARQRARERFAAIEAHSRAEMRRVLRNWAILICGLAVFALIMGFVVGMGVRHGR